MEEIRTINPILFIDVETSGLNPEVNSILEVAGVWFDIHDHSTEQAFHFFVKESYNIVVDPIAMEINKINIDWIKENGIWPSWAVRTIREAIEKRIGPQKRKVFLGGHNVKFDISFLKRMYELSGQNFDDDFDYHSFSTDSILMFMTMKGKVADNFPKLKYWCELNNVELKRDDGHSALKDILATTEALKNFLKNWNLYD